MKLTDANQNAIKKACIEFHYSRCVPAVMVAHNVYNDDDEWCGVICYGYGANYSASAFFNVNTGECYELLRVALNGKQKCTSECLAASLKKLHHDKPLLKLVFSYADENQNHKGIIYQATNWFYLSDSFSVKLIVNGKRMHPRTSFGKDLSNCEIKREKSKAKHLYVFCFDKKLRKKYKELAKPYPK